MVYLLYLLAVCGQGEQETEQGQGQGPEHSLSNSIPSLSIRLYPPVVQVSCSQPMGLSQFSATRRTGKSEWRQGVINLKMIEIDYSALLY